MAATGRSLAEVILEQNGQALDQAGVKGEERAKVLADVRKYLELASSDAKIDPASVPEDYRALLSMRAWLRGHARQDPLANVSKVKCPVLVIQGAKDFQVSPSATRARSRRRSTKRATPTTS
jgi:pimeloyl-ACP methyl ester carboxylesterase